MPENLHVSIRVLGRPEAEAFVQTVRVSCHQLETPQSLQVGMRHHRLDEPLAEALAPMALEDVDVAQIGVGRAIGHHTGEPDLLALVEHAEAQRVPDRFRDQFFRDALGPERSAQKAVDGVEIEPLRICRNRIRFLIAFQMRHQSASHPGRAEAALPARRVAKLDDVLDIDREARSHDKLGDFHSRPHLERAAAVVNQYHTDLAAIPAILVTSRNRPDDRQRGITVGAQGYVVKSDFDQIKLLEMIAGLVRG